MNPGKKAQAFVRLLRPVHWTKNGFVLAPLLFAFQWDTLSIIAGLKAFLAFCFTSSIVYIINDLVDIEADRKHPKKQNRPLAKRTVKIFEAVFLVLILMGAIGAISFSAPAGLHIALGIYLIINIAYTVRLKHVVIMDVTIIAIGFLLRVYTGSIAIEVPLSNWMMLSTFCLSLFLGFAKRRSELVLKEEEKEMITETPTENLQFYNTSNPTVQTTSRRVLDFYSIKLLDFYILISAGLAIVTYSLYTIDADIIAKTGTDKLILTVPLIIYGMFRYLYLVQKTSGGEDPSDLIIKDPHLIATVFLWIASIIMLFSGAFTNIPFFGQI